MPPIWLLTLIYDTEDGEVDVEHELTDLRFVPQIIDNGPSPNALVRAELHYLQGEELLICSPLQVSEDE